MRVLIAALTMSLALGMARRSDACCLTHCLFGRTTAPYAVGYAPYAYAPAVYQANYPVMAPTVAPTFAPTAAVPTTTSVLPPSWGGALPLNPASVYQSQRPAYYDNPSVYTGLPVTGAFSPAAAPVVSNYRGATPASSYLGAANAYPSSQPASTYAAAQVPTAPGLPLAPAMPTGAPMTALPATPVAPLFPPAPPQPSGLSRFFGSLLGTQYRTSYYQAPVTYYRPATTVDPVSGTAVTVQQPCTAYTQQLQRTPYSSWQAPSVGGPPTYVQPSPTCPMPSSFAPPQGAIGQVGATAPIGPNQLTVPIPSTAPPVAYPSTETTPNAAPLTGPPTTGGYAVPNGGYTAPNGGYTAPNGGGDRAPVDQPELRNRQPSNGNGNGSRNGYDDRYPSPQSEEDSTPKSYWELQDAQDSTAMIRSSRPESPAAAQPIPAPPDYLPPALERFSAPASSERQHPLEAPPLPPRSRESLDQAPDSNWVSAPIREASAKSPDPRSLSRPAPLERDTTWTPVR